MNEELNNKNNEDTGIHTMPREVMDNKEVKSKRSYKKIIVFIGLVIVLLLMIVGGLYLLLSKQKQDEKIQNTDSKNQEESPIAEAIKEKSKTDNDLDGLTDKEEEKYNLNKDSVDTDGDGLLDEAELNRFNTDPKKKDTDGDGYLDGVEVRNGYNPNGSGKLKE